MNKWNLEISEDKIKRNDNIKINLSIIFQK